MAEIYDQAEQFKAALVRRERIAASQLVRQYGRSWKRLRKLLLDVTDRIQAAQRQGIPISPAWLYQQQRYLELIAQTEREIRQFADSVNKTVEREQQAAIKAATRNTATLIRTATSTTNLASIAVTVLPVEAVQSMVGFLADGSPLTALLNQLPRATSKAVADALTEAVALGYNPRKTAAIIRRETGMTLTRSLTIARTETLRAYREATHQTYQANKNIVAGWYWVASLSRRTCAACIALHGTFHPMEERMSTHVRCRCTSIPGIKGDPSPFTETGQEWFDKQPADVQQAVFSNQAAWKAYSSGQAQLTDFVGKRVNPVWGDSYVQLGAKRAINREGRFPGYERPQPGATLPAGVAQVTQPAVPARAATLAEAEQAAIARGLARRVDYKRMLLDDANKINDEIGSIFREWNLRPLDTILPGARGTTHASANGRLINYNGQRFSDPAEIAKSFREAQEYQRRKLAVLRSLELAGLPPSKLVKHRKDAKFAVWSAQTSIENFAVDTFIHEVGHVIQDQILGMLNPRLVNDRERMLEGSKADKFRKEWKRIYRTRGDDRYKISRYADTNADEYFAESFLIYRRRPQDLPPKIRDYFDRLKLFANE